MARTLKRVPLDFDHPLGEIWSGYVNEHYIPCPHCEGGWSAAYRYLKEHLYYQRNISVSISNPLPPFVCNIEQELASLSTEERNDKLMKTGIYKTLMALGEKHNAPKKWDTCTTCNGEGVHPDAIEAYNKWVGTEPPTGQGFQMWETTTEGSPKSPVFGTLDALCEWCEPNATIYGHDKGTKEEWYELLGGKEAAERCMS